VVAKGGHALEVRCERGAAAHALVGKSQLGVHVLPTVRC
jgi:hypothetical protein